VIGSFAVLPAGERVAAELSAAAPDNPFATTAYLEARRRAGWATWAIAEVDTDGHLHGGCAAFVAARGPFRKLEIPSLPAEQSSSPFWETLRELCGRQTITKLELGTFNSPLGVEIPEIGSCTFRTRCEFILDLGGDPYARLTNRHRANIKRAEKAGLVIRQTRAAAAVEVHQGLIGHSMDRRRFRGENVPAVEASLDAITLIESGAGNLYQAVAGDTVLSSALVLRAPQGAYGHSTGTSPEGMKVGASHYLIHSISKELGAEGVPTLNFGAADQGSGLARYKRDFGTQMRCLPSATCYIGPASRRRLYQATESMRRERQALVRWLKDRAARPIHGRG
jgi:Acetyltransferase (GNAT) domain